ncbi:toxin-antitoxin system YwqK family antitoxin [Motilimonas sp. E26]|uniref:toxin-antitoxin system YwqK family antitoxin n=1 Tax=Motilimonas sp. E26 TaxID=2865674 RepID=UPI001E3766FF|nr:toxin-antitoxin system YwqK family antitoxin [Motilimonas sp. E26]MCE0555438.1 hypothetical protein [Motilimonas sp. E26]
MRLLFILAILLPLQAWAENIWLDHRFAITNTQDVAEYYLKEAPKKSWQGWKVSVFNAHDNSLLLTGTLDAPNLETGNWIQKSTYFSNGELKDSATFEDGKLHGEYKKYYLSGGLAETKQYKNDKPIGEHNYYYESGQLKSSHTHGPNGLEGMFKEYYEESEQLKSSVPYQAGKAHGESKYYYRSGALHETRQYSNHALIGEHKTYFESGQLESTHIHTDTGIEGVSRKFYESGQPRSEAFYVADKKNNLFTQWNADGSIWEKTQYKDDKRHGLSQRFFNNSKQLSTESMYQHGKQTGIEKAWFENGQLKSTTDMLDDKRNGWTKEYNENGILIRSAQFEQGKPIGTSKFFFNSGELREEITYLTPDKKSSRKTYYQNGNTNSLVQYDKKQQKKSEIRYLENGEKIYQFSHSKSKHHGRLIKEVKYDDGKMVSQYEKALDGSWSLDRSYSTKGKLTYRQEYLNNQLSGQQINQGYYNDTTTSYYRAGKRHGRYITTTNKGVITEQGAFKEDEKVGKWISQDRDGNITITHYNQHGQLHGSKTVTDSNGKLITKLNYAAGEYHGQLLERDEAGKVANQGRYINGVKVGPWVETKYNYGTKQIWKGTYNNEGSPINEWRLYSDKGYVLAIVPYNREGQIHGLVYDFNPNGSLAYTTQYKNNKANGYEIRFRDGEEASRTLYKDNYKI